MSLPLSLLALLASIVSAQYIDGWGVSGGSGPVGGIGDTAHPVLQAQSFITDGLVPLTPNTTRQLAPGPAPLLVQNSGSSSASSCSRRKVVVDSTARGAQQEMLGFGHAWTDSTVEVFNQLEPQLLDQLMDELFGQDGNNMGFMRHTIGSSDLSGVQYSYDDNGPSFNLGEPDPTLSNFDIGPYGTQMAELLAKMGTYKGDVFLYGAPWSYPGWMKNNDLFIAPNDGSAHFLINNTLRPNYYSQAIEYLTKYVDAFKTFGVSINGLSLQNEPLNYQGGYPCMFLDAADEANLLQAGLGAAMHERGVKILAYDHNTDQPAYPARVIQGAPEYADAAAWHCYQGPVADYTIFEDFHYNFPTTPQFMTECSNTGLEPGTTNFWIAQNFMPSVRYGASGASFWVLATDPEYGPHSPYGGCTTCSGSIFVNSSTVYEKTIDYYMMGHFSRYIRRGAVNHRVVAGQQGAGTDWTSQFYVNAVQNPDRGWAVVFLNTFPDDHPIDLEFTESGLVWQGTIPGSTVVTWLLPADDTLEAHGGPHSGTTLPASMYPRPSWTRGYNATFSQPAWTRGHVPPFPLPTSMIPAYASTAAGTTESCAAETTSSSSSSTLVPVPNTTHTIAT